MYIPSCPATHLQGYLAFCYNDLVSPLNAWRLDLSDLRLLPNYSSNKKTFRKNVKECRDVTTALSDTAIAMATMHNTDNVILTSAFGVSIIKYYTPQLYVKS